MSQELKALQAIEKITGDDFCEELDMLIAFHPEELTSREKTMADKLSKIYRLAHSHDTEASCYDIHAAWRLELLAEGSR